MAKAETCPICRRASAAPNTPFCSRGCRDRDLLQWLGEGYRIPTEAVEQEPDSGLDTPGPHD